MALRGSARWQQAARDADLRFPAGAGQCACALGVAIEAQRTPRLYTLLGAAASMMSAPRPRRPRTTTCGRAHSCSTGSRPVPRRKKTGCAATAPTPSGHSAMGWAWALILSEIAPDRATALVARGHSYGESRLVCNVHWQSDVLAGRFMGAAAVARLHAAPTFRADLEAARGEIARARAQRATPEQDCAAQAQALQARPPSAL